MPSLGMAYLFWAASFFGMAGLHRFYLGKFGSGLIYFFTWGLFGFGTLYDALTLPEQVRDAQLRRRLHSGFGDGDAYSQALEALRREQLGRSDAGRRGTGQPPTIEQVILRTAQRNNGVASPATVALEGNVSTDQAKSHLERLAERGFCEIKVRKSGSIAYVFPELRSPEAEDEFEDL